MTRIITKITLVLAVVSLTISMVGPAGAIQANSIGEVDDNHIAQQMNSTETSSPTPSPTPTTTPAQDEQCSPRSEPQLQQADLHTDDSVIEKGSPGRMSGGIALDVTAECPVKVQITLNVPNNMYIEGASDIGSGGGGLVTNTFVVEPGEVKDLAAFVYGTETGKHTVAADITYFPVGHQDMAREIDGLGLTYTVKEPVTREEGASGSSGNDDDGGNGGTALFPSTLEWLLGIVTLAVVGLLIAVGRKSNIKIRR